MIAISRVIAKNNSSELLFKDCCIDYFKQAYMQ